MSEAVWNTYSPYWTHPEALKLSESPLGIIWKVSLVASAFTCVFLWMLKVVPVPIKIGKIEDAREREIKFKYYVGYILSWAHAPVTAGLGAYFAWTNGISYAGPNHLGEKNLVIVSPYTIGSNIQYSFGYFLFDTVCGILMNYNDKFVTFHHCLALYTDYIILNT